MDVKRTKYNLDSKDKKILMQLNDNTRMSLTEMSKKIGVPIDTIKYRMERMQKAGVYKLAVVLNHVKVGYPIFNEAHFQFVNFTAEEEKRVKNYIQSDPHIIYSAKLAGKYDYEITIMAVDMIHFDEILNRFKTAFQNIIKDFDIAIIIEEYALEYLVDLINIPGKGMKK